jgi:EAL domain-containing protein (putative c-di-GMP-specific phosphodiesterase class I)/DNA-binding NarL/FixJ family response regulator
MLVDKDDVLLSARVSSQERPSLQQFAEARVLLIDDEPANLALLTQLLSRSGLRNLHSLSDSRQAMAAIESLNPDLILLDLHMPGVDGYAILAELRHVAAGSYLPVLVLSADTTRQAINRALALGAKDFLTKPFDIDEATLRVRNLLEAKELHNTLRHHNVRLHRRLDEFERAADRRVEASQAMGQRIRDVLRAGSLRMVFQPIMNITDGRMVGCEALARFLVDPQQSPDRWFAEAERAGLGIELETAAIAAAVQALPALPDDVFLALNMSPSTALSSALEDLLAGIDLSRIVLELTEHVAVEDYDAVSSGLASLRAHGARLALDDTGAGYAGLRHLLGLRPEVIKLDISLTHDIDHDPVRRALAGALVSFAGDVDAAVVAEGVENEREQDALLRLGVRWVQGFHVARPQSLSSVVELAFS